MTELIHKKRASEFVSYCLENDLQILLVRRTAQKKLAKALAGQDDNPDECLEYTSDAFDKLHTYLAQNDQQVHYASAQSTVGIYAVIKILGDLRRVLRDSGASILVSGSPLASPSRGPRPPGSSSRSGSPSRRLFGGSPSGEQQG